MKNYSGIKVEVKNEDLNKSNVVYKLTFPNGKVYIGQTIQKLRDRLQHHCNNSLNSKQLDYNSPKARAIRKYITFQVDILYNGEELDNQEIYWIDYYNSIDIKFGYNLESGGSLNKIVSNETKDKISKIHKGKPKSKEHIKKIRESNLGQTRSEETKIKLSELRKGKYKGKDNPNAKAIIVTEISTGIEKEFGSLIDAGNYYEVNAKSISDNLNGRSKTFKKRQYIAKYI